MRFLVVDDHPIVRVGVRQMVAEAWPEATIVEAESVAEATVACAEQRFDAIMLDLMLPDSSGVESAARVLQTAGTVPILVLSSSDESVYAARLLQMGVKGYLSKERAPEELVLALQRLLAGKRFVTASMAEQLVDVLGGRASADAPHERLSSQEHRVMLLMAAGKTPAEMARLLQLSVRTVGTYRSRIFAKTGWKTNVELAKYCVEHGLIARSA